MRQFIKCFIFYFCSIFWLECVYKSALFHNLFNIDLLYMSLFTTIYALFFTFLTGFLRKKVRSTVLIILFCLMTILFISEAMFTLIYDTTFSIYSLNMADQAFDFRRILYEEMYNHALMIISLCIPFIIFVIFKKRIYFDLERKYVFSSALVYFALYLIVFVMISFTKTGIYSPYNLYFNTHAPTITVTKLGLITEFKLDIGRYMFGFTPKLEVTNENETSVKEESSDDVIEYNKLNINFENDFNNTAISTLNSYFKNRRVTEKNDYTGIYEGKNLIYILAEGFNTIAVDENITPTLFKLVNSSFKFTNYYSPMFMSTTGGEYQFTTSLIPTQKGLNLWKEGNVSFPYSIGNIFSNKGYHTQAFHNYTYTYYKRQKTMPTLGFNNYLGCGNGLEVGVKCKVWPPSDVEMVEHSSANFIGKERFAIYYITVSGHTEYNFYGNNMAMKNKKYVESLDYSTPAKAYLATQIELDRALELLLYKLEQANILDDTVIVLSGDHYPYGLSLDAINELSTFERDETFGVHKSELIIYNSKQEFTVIDKLSTSVDVLPTILNMFGVDYDSRLLLGTDIMSREESIVIFADYSWITEKGRYNAKTSTFTPNEGAIVPENYVDKINNDIQNRVIVSDRIVENDYYRKILGQ